MKTGNIVKAKPSGNATALSPDNILPPDVKKLVDDFFGYRRKFAENYVGMGTAVYIATETLTREKQRQFCYEVGIAYESREFKNLVLVGKNAPRLASIMELLPDKPTTIDWMVRIKPEEYAIVAPHVTPKVKKKELLALLPPKPTRSRRSKAGKTMLQKMLEANDPAQRLVIDLGAAEDKIVARQEFEALAARLHCKVATD